MKRIIVIILSFIVVCFCVFVLFSKYSNKAMIGQKNRNNIELIKIGMNLDDVEKIMGKADTVYYVNNIKSPIYKKKVFSYYRGPGIYGYLQIILEPDVDTVIQVVNIIE